MKIKESLDLVLGILMAFVVALSAFLLLCGPCPNCHRLVGMRDYCSACGYEIIAHCDNCGAQCAMPFCNECGAEQ